MAAIVWADVVGHAPELASISPLAQEDILNFVAKALSTTEWGDESHPRLRLGRIMLAAHLGTMNLRGTDAYAPVASETVGGISTSFEARTLGTELLDQTPYGQMFRQLIRTSRSRAPFVV